MVQSLFPAITQLPELIRSKDSVIQIAFFCTDARYQSLGEKAFSVHGAYKVVDSSKADYNIQIALLEEPSAALRVFEKDRLMHQSKLSEESWYESFLSALDQAVQITGVSQNLKGIFSERFVFVGKRNSSQELYQSDFFFS